MKRGGPDGKETRFRSRAGYFFGAQQEENKEAETLAVEAIETNPHQPRKYFSEESIDELAESIRAVGVLQPLLIKKTAILIC